MTTGTCAIRRVNDRNVIALSIFRDRAVERGPLDEPVDTGEEIVGEQGFEAEVDVEAGVFVFGFGKAADDEYGNCWLELADFADELGAVHAGHDVVGDDEVDGGGVVVVAELLEGAFGVECGDDRVTGSLEDGLACCGLNGVVV